MTLKVKGKSQSRRVVITFVYGLHTVGEKRALWEELQALNVRQFPLACDG